MLDLNCSRVTKIIVWITFCIPEKVPRNWVIQSYICRVAETAAEVRVFGRENEAFLQFITQIPRAKKNLRLPCESINGRLSMIMFLHLVGVNIPCFA